MIDFARAADDLDERWYPHQIDTTPADRAGIVWLCGGCTARVTARRSHTRGGTRVLAHFATWPRPNHEPSPHDDTCDFLPPVRPSLADGTPPTQTEPARPAPAPAQTWVLAPTASAVSVPVAIGGGGVQADAPRSDTASTPASPDSPRRDTTPARPTIAGAHRVLDLLRHFDDEPMQMLRFTATWRPGADGTSTELTWGELYYPPGRHHLLLAQADDHALPEHPVAVSGPVEHVAHTHNRRRQGDDLSIFLRLGAAGTGNRLVLRGPPEVLPAVEPGAIVLALATWTVFTPRRGDHSPTYCTAWVTTTGQVLELGADDPYR